MSVDFPAPELPSSAPVCPGSSAFRDLRRHVVDEIGFAQEHLRCGATVFGQHQIALQPPRIVVAVEAHHDEDDVDIGGDDLLLGELAGGLAREVRPAWQDRFDGGRALAGPRADGNPVAHRSHGVPPGGLVQQLA